jgi:hypothetical protein
LRSVLGCNFCAPSRLSTQALSLSLWLCSRGVGVLCGRAGARVGDFAGGRGLTNNTKKISLLSLHFHTYIVSFHIMSEHRLDHFHFFCGGRKWSILCAHYFFQIVWNSVFFFFGGWFFASCLSHVFSKNAKTKFFPRFVITKLSINFYFFQKLLDCTSGFHRYSQQYRKMLICFYFHTLAKLS